MNVYTLNGQVLTNDGKWLQKKEEEPEPITLVLNLSNAILTVSGGTVYAAWEGPEFPNGCECDGKEFTVVNTNNSTDLWSGLLYSASTTGNGSTCIDMSKLRTSSTGTCSGNAHPITSDDGKYFVIHFGYSTEEAARAVLANMSITIVY